MGRSTREKKAKGFLLGSLIAWIGVGMPILAFCGLVAGVLGAAMGSYLLYSADLPKIPDLRSYKPKTVSTFYADDGTVIGLFYREKRFPVPLSSIPQNVVNAFLAAEDARFFSHTGIDWPGVFRAVVKNVEAGNFAQGGSTITQQVTRNFLLSKEKKISRKIREALLSFRLEKSLTKEEILEIYLNEIYLGKGAYGIEAAAGTHFGKTTPELSIAEAAMLAGFVQNPSKFCSPKNLELALKRRDFVLGRMLQNGFINEDEYREALQETPKFRESLPNPYEKVPYFTEAVRQYIVSRYGENRLYNEGLQVWTTCDPNLQNRAAEALLKGASAWERREGRPPGLVKRLKNAEVKEFLKTAPPESYAVGDLVKAVVLTNHRPKKRKKKSEDSGQECTLGLPGGAQVTMRLAGDLTYRPNDMLEFKVTGVEAGGLQLEQQTLPPVEGALVCIENHTGFVRALAGGLDFDRSSFNRAFQAMRQPGSAFKPFIYATALEHAQYGPQTLVVDEPIAVAIDPREHEWMPANSDGAFAGPIPLRHALAQSRNIVAVKVLMDAGIDRTARLARQMGIKSPIGRHLSMALGASEVTPLELTSAYTVFPNMGMRVQPVMVKKVVDRFGKVLEDNTGESVDVVAASQVAPVIEEDHDASSGEAGGQPSSGRAPNDTGLIDEMRSMAVDDSTPQLDTHLEGLLSGQTANKARFTRQPIKRVLSPQAAYLMLSMLREVCVTGTGASVARLGRRDLGGKTGTTDDCTDAWFVGFNPTYTTGVWLGYDAKVSLGRREYGGAAALPIWKAFMKDALGKTPSRDYPVPPGIAFPAEAGTYARQGTDALLQADWDPLVGFQLKEVCSVDTVPVPASGAWYNQGNVPTDQVFGGMMASGAVRILSPTGKTLGLAYPYKDEKGRVSLYRDYAQADREPQKPSDPQEPTADWLLPRAGEVLRQLRQYVPPFSYGGWVQ